MKLATFIAALFAIVGCSRLPMRVTPRLDQAALDSGSQSDTAAYREKRMDELDRAFYKEPKRIEAFLGEFIRSHPELFTK